jgi:hypothetical protein
MVTRRRAGVAAARRLPPPLRGGAKRPFAACPVGAGGGWGHLGATDQSVQQPSGLDRWRRIGAAAGRNRCGAFCVTSSPPLIEVGGIRRRGCPAIPRRSHHDVRGHVVITSRVDWASRADLERRDATIRKMLPKRSERRRRPIRRVPHGRPRMPNRCRLSYGRTPGDGGIVSPPRRKHFSTARSGRPEATGPTRQPLALARGADAGIGVSTREVPGNPVYEMAFRDCRIYRADRRPRPQA